MRLCPVSPGIGIRIIRKDFYQRNEAIVTSPPQGSYIVFLSMTFLLDTM
jgi:hypothetical protein